MTSVVFYLFDDVLMPFQQCFVFDLKTGLHSEHRSNCLGVILCCQFTEVKAVNVVQKLGFVFIV